MQTVTHRDVELEERLGQRGLVALVVEAVGGLLEVIDAALIGRALCIGCVCVRALGREEGERGGRERKRERGRGRERKR
jgi:hypothetical protein